MKDRDQWRRAAVVLLLVGILVVVVALDVTVFSGEDGDHRHAPPATVERQLGGPGKKTIPVSPEAVKKIEREQDGKPDKVGPCKEGTTRDAQGACPDAAPHSGLRDETPAGTPVEDPAAAKEADRKAERVIERQTTGSNVVPEQKTLATPQQRGCTTRLVRNFSQRNGARPGLAELHFTVSGRQKGPQDALNIVAYFDIARSQASSNYVLDDEGYCYYIVSELNKAWTQGWFNSSTACSFEVIARGNEAYYIGARGGPGWRKLVMVLSDCMKRWGIPLRRANTVGCGIAQAGLGDHEELACGNFHTDIGPFDKRDHVIANLLTDITTFRRGRAATPPNSKAAQAACDRLNFHRARAHKVGKWYPSRLKRANELATLVARERGHCPSKYRRAKAS